MLSPAWVPRVFKLSKKYMVSEQFVNHMLHPIGKKYQGKAYTTGNSMAFERGKQVYILSCSLIMKPVLKSISPVSANR